MCLLPCSNVDERAPQTVNLRYRKYTERVVQSQQLSIGEIDVSKIKFDPKSRDDIPKILRGLQHLYMDPALRCSIFELLARQVAPRVSESNGRPGMTLWTILVCGVIRLDLNIDFDRLHELVNHHDSRNAWPWCF